VSPEQREKAGQEPAGQSHPLQRLVEIMRRLRDPKTGCEWDSVQTFETVAPYTIEEAYEVADAIARGDMDALADELGDLQLQVVFHARMAEEAGQFTLDDVIGRICAKMERRHPHIFGDAAEGGHHLWEIIKAEERAGNEDKSALAGVALALPALERAAKLQRRAARTGFDWPDASGPRAKIDEELAELEAETEHSRMLEEMGDLLFAVVNAAALAVRPVAPGPQPGAQRRPASAARLAPARRPASPAVRPRPLAVPRARAAFGL
jgi:ATP diphosphatase